MNNFRDIVYNCGLSLKGTSRILNIPYDTVKSWSQGRRKCPDTVIEKMERLQKAKDRIFKL